MLLLWDVGFMDGMALVVMEAHAKCFFSQDHPHIVLVLTTYKRL